MIWSELSSTSAMYNPLLHKDRATPPGHAHTRSLPRPGRGGGAEAGAGAGAGYLSLTRPAKLRGRSRSPARPQLSLVICPDFHEYPEGMREYSPAPATPSPRTHSPLALHRVKGAAGAGAGLFAAREGGPRHPHALARARGTEVLTSSSSLPCSPVFARLQLPGGVGGRTVGARFSPVSRELSLPSSPVLPRIHIQDFDPKSKVSPSFVSIRVNKVERSTKKSLEIGS